MNEVTQLKILLNKAFQEIKELREENARLKKRIEELEGKQKLKEIPIFVKPDKRTKSNTLGRPEGHEGFSRPLPDRVDEEINHTLKNCPDCNTKLRRVLEIRSRFVEDIIPQQKYKVIKHNIPRCWCPNCKKIVEAKPDDVLPKFRFGLNTMLFVCFLHFGLALTNEKIQKLIRMQYSLEVSIGEISHILTKTGEYFGPKFEEFKQKIRETKAHHEDETGWRKNGRNHWLWTFISDEVALFKIARSRGHDVPLKIVGKGYSGNITSDGLSAYNVLAEKTKCTQQKCWVHILRNSKKLSKTHTEGKYVHRKLKEIYKDAKTHEETEDFVKIPKLINRIEKLNARRYKHSEVRKFIKSLAITHKYNLFRFIGNKNIKSDNNTAERAIRKAVIIRKISGGNRSQKGAIATERMLSFTQTCQLQQKDFIHEGKEYLQNLFHLRN